MPIITEAGFRPADSTPFISAAALETLTIEPVRVALPNDADADDLVPHFDRVETFAIPFPSFADGRGFSLARRLRDLGYRGTLRASGHVISDQWQYAKACGFDEVEIDEALAARQPEDLWQQQARPNYRAKLAKTVEEPFEAPANVFDQRVTAVRHFTDRLFSFRITRPASFRFRSGEFVMIGLPGKKPIFRAYSIASPSWDDEIEFFSIKVPDGPLTEHLQKIREGDAVWMRKKSTGTLVADALLPKKRLWMFSTGTGIAPFASLVRDPEVYEKFDQLILVQTTRNVAELAYGFDLIAGTRSDPLVGSLATEARLVHVTSATRDAYVETRRITTMMDDRSLWDLIGVAGLSAETDAAMICGSMDMLRDVKSRLEGAGLVEGSNSKPGDFTVERAFVD